MNKLSTLLFILLAQSLFFAINLNAQKKASSISGSVTTRDGKPALYVNVSLKNTGKTTQTNEQGNFIFKNIAPGQYTLKISAVGISNLEQTIMIVANEDTKTTLSITETSAQLTDVAISGYKTSNRKPIDLGKIAIAPIDLPQSVQIIGNQVITDQQANRLSDVLRNVNGISLGADRGSVTGGNFFARGYSLGANNIFKNGSRASSGGMPEMSTIESVEVLKGSAALLYGAITGGAVVNMVTKRPKFENGGEINMRGGSYNLYKPTGDIYGPITKNLAFRVIGTYENAGSFRDDVKTKRFYVNPSLLYKIGTKTDILLQGDYLKSDYTPDFGIGTIGNQIVDIGRSSYVGAPWAYNNTKTFTSQLNVNHKFNDSWKLNVLANIQAYNRDYFAAERPFANAAGIAARNVTRSKTQEYTYNEQINLNGAFKTGIVAHTMLIGADADQSKITSNGFTFNQDLPAFNYGDVNLLNPDTYFGSGILPTANNITRTFAPIYRMGVFVQDLVSLTEKFKMLAGIRYTFQKIPRTVTENINAGIKTLSDNKLDKSKTESALSPKFALIYQPIKTTSLYVSYANNFISNTGTDIYKAALDPSIINQYEAGIKNDLLKGRLSVNVTWYKIKNNKFVQTAILDANGKPNSDGNIKEFSGATASDGIEVDITGTIVKGLNFLGGYSYNYMRYTKTLDKTGIVEGERLVGSTKNTANGSIFYTFQDGGVKGLKLGTSLFYTGDRLGGRNTNKAGTSSGIIPLNGFTTFDFSAGYAWRRISLLAKVSNITNTLNYYVHENYSVNPIPPRQFITTLSYRF